MGRGYPSFTRDSARVQLVEGGWIVRVRVADGRIERVASLEQLSPVSVAGLPWWVGLAPDDSPITLRQTRSVAEVYALDVEWP
jgi:hypothetical protein